MSVIDLTLFLLLPVKVMAPLSTLMLLLAVAMIPGTWSHSQENELDYGYWNYREGGKSQAVGIWKSKTKTADLVVHDIMNSFNMSEFCILNGIAL